MNESSLKIVLLVLSGDAKTARDWLKQNYASASLEIVSRYKLEKHSALGRVRAARQLRADIFVIATERLAWQRGQNAMRSLIEDDRARHVTDRLEFLAPCGGFGR